jgi:homoserine O-succinyltransferase
MTPHDQLPFGTVTIPGSGSGAYRRFDLSDPNCLDIALVNNMPDSALRATERQFASLLRSAAGTLTIRLTIFAIDEVPRGEQGRAHVEKFYCPIGKIWQRDIDGLIVTGTEPRTERLDDEPYWDSLIRLLEWADRRNASSVWSCLAAHAVVLHLDGIARRRLPEKRFGVFDCTPATDHPWLAGAARRLRMPHSRWNDVSAAALSERGYQLLTTSTAGADAFVKQANSLLVFLQGHPEYEADTLLLEYRRDVGRYLRGERETYPQVPIGYFDGRVLDELAALEACAMKDRREEQLARFPTASVAQVVQNTWETFSTDIYRNWLLHLSAEKSRRFNARPVAV